MNAFELWLANEHALISKCADVEPFKTAKEGMEVAWDGAMEAAAKICESRAATHEVWEQAQREAQKCAYAIRMLKTPSPEQNGGENDG